MAGDGLREYACAHEKSACIKACFDCLYEPGRAAIPQAGLLALKAFRDFRESFGQGNESSSMVLGGIAPVGTHWLQDRRMHGG
jgi:hypothetical protein